MPSKRRDIRGPWERQGNLDAWTIIAKSSAEYSAPADEAEDLDAMDIASELADEVRRPSTAAADPIYAAEVRRCINALGVNASALDDFVLDGLARFEQDALGQLKPAEAAIAFVSSFWTFFTESSRLPASLRDAAAEWQRAGAISDAVAADVLERLP